MRDFILEIHEFLSLREINSVRSQDRRIEQAVSAACFFVPVFKILLFSTQVLIFAAGCAIIEANKGFLPAQTPEG